MLVEKLGRSMQQIKKYIHILNIYHINRTMWESMSQMIRIQSNGLSQQI